MVEGIPPAEWLHQDVPASSIHKSHCLECLPILNSSLWEPVSPTHSPDLTKFDCTRLGFWRVSFNWPYLRTIKFHSLEVIMLDYEHAHPLESILRRGEGGKRKGRKENGVAAQELELETCRFEDLNRMNMLSAWETLWPLSLALVPEEAEGMRSVCITFRQSSQLRQPPEFHELHSLNLPLAANILFLKSWLFHFAIFP